MNVNLLHIVDQKILKHMKWKILIREYARQVIDCGILLSLYKHADSCNQYLTSLTL